MCHTITQRPHVTLHQGFACAESLAAKVVSVFDSCREQLSRQKHYDFGLRALKSVLASAGIIRRRLSAGDAGGLNAGDAADGLSEDAIVAEAFKGSVLPKLLQDDAVIMQSLLLQVSASTPNIQTTTP